MSMLDFSAGPGGTADVPQQPAPRPATGSLAGRWIAGTAGTTGASALVSVALDRPALAIGLMIFAGMLVLLAGLLLVPVTWRAAYADDETVRKDALAVLKAFLRLDDSTTAPVAPAPNPVDVRSRDQPARRIRRGHPPRHGAPPSRTVRPSGR